jgi:hypothetical protein
MKSKSDIKYNWCLKDQNESEPQCRHTIGSKK